MIHVKFCMECGKSYDFKDCPYCNLKKGKKEV